MQLNEFEVTLLKLKEIFTNAFMTISDVDETTVMVTPDEVPLELSVDLERKYIGFAVYQPLENCSMSQAIQKANGANADKFFPRFYIVEVDDSPMMVADYCLPFERGLNVFHLINSIKFFEKVVVVTYQEFFQE